MQAQTTSSWEGTAWSLQQKGSSRPKIFLTQLQSLFQLLWKLGMEVETKLEKNLRIKLTLFKLNKTFCCWPLACPVALTPKKAFLGEGSRVPGPQLCGSGVREEGSVNLRETNVLHAKTYFASHTCHFWSRILYKRHPKSLNELTVGESATSLSTRSASSLQPFGEWTNRWKSLLSIHLFFQ